MPVLTNPRHERFAQELAAGKSATEAYKLAGYEPKRQNASRLMANDDINARVAELQHRSAERAEITVESLIAECEEARQGAIGSKQWAAAIAAVKEKGVLSGKRVERVERGKPGEFGDMDAEGLRAYIARETAALGLSHSAVARTNGSGKSH